jgi:dTDP-glucose 4,6-dehydratase
MRYFVTGGAGFIGSNYIEHLFREVDDVSRVTIYDKFTYAANSRNYLEFSSDPRLSVVKGDICDLVLLRQSMKDHDFVIHFAAESHVDRSIDDGSAFVLTNVLGTYNVLEAAREVGIRTVIHISTDEVYGSVIEGAADENCSLAPNSPYAASKAASDLIARSYFVTHKLDVRTTRCCNNYGKYQYPEKLIPVIIKKLSLGEKIPVYGDGSNVREWIHVSDHVSAIQLVLEEGSPGEIYNIGTQIHYSNNDLADIIIEQMEKNKDQKSYVSDRKGHDFRYSVSSEKIKALGFKTKTNFSTEIKETILWYRNNANWWDEPL